MAIRYNPKRQDLLYAANAKGVVLQCKPGDESCKEVLAGTFSKHPLGQQSEMTVLS